MPFKWSMARCKAAMMLATSKPRKEIAAELGISTNLLKRWYFIADFKLMVAYHREALYAALHGDESWPTWPENPLAELLVRSPAAAMAYLQAINERTRRRCQD